jgi:hypothetical protein
VPNEGIAPRPAAERLYFINGPVDVLFMGGVSIALFFVIVALGSPPRSPVTWTTAAALMWVCNWPHFSATNYRLYHSRENIAQYPFTALAIPLLLLAAVLASFRSPEGIAPALVKLFLVWSPYHFSAQSMGITLIYARRAGFFVGRAERLALSGFIYGTYFTSIARAEVGTRGASYFGVAVPTFGLPEWAGTASSVIMHAFGAAALLLVARWSFRNRRILPPIVLLPAVAQYVWFVLGARIPAYNEFVPFFHSLQYLLIAWAMQLRERITEGGLAPSVPTVARETFRWGAVNVAGGAFLFWVLPRLAEVLGNAPPSVPGFAEAVVVSAVQIHHFFVDGVIWKLRNPKVSAPLMVSLEELIHSRPASPVSP